MPKPETTTINNCEVLDELKEPDADSWHALLVKRGEHQFFVRAEGPNAVQEGTTVKKKGDKGKIVLLKEAAALIGEPR